MGITKQIEMKLRTNWEVYFVEGYNIWLSVVGDIVENAQQVIVVRFCVLRVLRSM